MRFVFTGIVKEVRAITASKGVPIARPFEVVSFFDREVGGDVRVIYPLNGSGFQVGAEVPLDIIVKGVERNFQVGYSWISNVVSKSK